MTIRAKDVRQWPSEWHEYVEVLKGTWVLRTGLPETEHHPARENRSVIPGECVLVPPYLMAQANATEDPDGPPTDFPRGLPDHDHGPGLRLALVQSGGQFIHFGYGNAEHVIHIPAAWVLPVLDALATMRPKLEELFGEARPEVEATAKAEELAAKKREG